MEFTGERLVPGKLGLELLELEHRARYEFVARFVKGKRVLDLGCGTGYGTGILGETASAVLGADISEEAVEYASGIFAREAVVFAALDVCGESFADDVKRIDPEPFDVVVAFEFIEHVEAPVQVLEHVRALIAPGGMFLVSTPNISRHQKIVEKDNPFHVIEYDFEQFDSLLRSRFENVEIFGQMNHLASSLNYNRDGTLLAHGWRSEERGEAKYYIGICSDAAVPDEMLESFVLTADDSHLTLLQSKLQDSRNDQAVKSQRIRLLEESIAVLKKAADEDPRQSKPADKDQLAAQMLQLLEEKNEAVRGLTGDLEEHRLEAAARSAELARAQEAVEDLRRGRSESEEKLQDRAEQLADLRRNVERLETELERARAEASRSADALSREAADLAGRLAESERGREELGARLAAEQSQSRELRAELGELENELADIKAGAEHAEVTARSKDLRRVQIALAEAARERETALRLAADARRSLAGTAAERAAGEKARVQAVLAERKLELQQELIGALTAEMRAILSSNRYKVALGFVRLKDEVLGRTETDPEDSHLGRHQRRYQEQLARLEAEAAGMAGERSLGAEAPAERPVGELPDSAEPSARDSQSFEELLAEPLGDIDMELLTDGQRERLAGELLALEQRALVSVIMPTWNRAGQIEEAIASVRGQTYANWELIVVDDGSDDNTGEVVERVAAKDDRIQYLSIEHGGVSAARDVGLTRAGGDIVAYLDSDNAWAPDYLLFMVQALERTGRRCAYCALRIVDHDAGGQVSYRKRRFRLNNLLKNNFIDINVFVHRKEVADELGGFDDTLKRWVDWDLVLRYVKCYPPVEVPAALGLYNRKRDLRQITTEVTSAYKLVVLNKHLIDWPQQVAQLEQREAGRTTVVIPVFNQLALTEACLGSIFEHAGSDDFDVLVVDNGSKDGTAEALAALARSNPRLRFIKNYENYSFALGCNLGAAAARGEYLVFLNNDTLVTPSWLGPLVEPLKTDPEVGVVGAKLLFEDGTLQSGGMAFNEKSKIPFNIYQGFENGDPAIEKPRTFQCVTGACLAIRASDFFTLGGFDPIYVNGCEDLDLQFRMRKQSGKRVLYNPASTVYHLEGKTEGRGRAIMYNRELFVDRWRDEVVADDTHHFAEDGFEVGEYVKKGTEKHGEAAAYYPVLEPSRKAWTGRPKRKRKRAKKAAPRDGSPPIEPIISMTRPKRTLSIGFSTIWHARGISFHTRQLAHSLEAAGMQTHVFARWESEAFQNLGPVYHPRVTNAGDDPTPEELLRWVRLNAIDLMIFMEVHPKDWKRVSALKKAGVPIVGYENLDTLRVEMFDRYEQFDHFLFNTFYGRGVFREKFPDLSSLVIPWGVPPGRPARSRTRPKTGNGKLSFVHVAGWGGVNNRKNTDTLIRAFHEAGPSNATLELYSQAPIEQYGEDCVKILESNRGIKLHLGTVDDILKAYRGADMLLWPSKREGLGLPIVEALSTGVPVLISDGYMMKQWPVRDRHAVVCESSAEQGPMFLPEMQVDPEALVRLLRRVCDGEVDLAKMKRQVDKDRAIWTWSWQQETFAEQIRRIVEDEGYRPGQESGYIPKRILAHERARVKAEQVSPSR